MANFWLTFRIADRIVSGRDDDDRRLMLYETVRQLTSSKWWKDPTSFVLFNSDRTIEEIAHEVSKAISPLHDVVLIREDGCKSARVIGVVEDTDLFTLMEYVKQA